MDDRGVDLCAAIEEQSALQERVVDDVHDLSNGRVFLKQLGEVDDPNAVG